MSNRNYSRRQFLAASVGATGLWTIGERGSAARPTSKSEDNGGGAAAYESTVSGETHYDGLVLEQDGQRVPLSPLSFQNQTIQEFYGADRSQHPGFHWPEESNTSTNLERARTSRLFLYKGPDGLGYVIIHGSEDGPGGAASFGIRHTPRSGKLFVQDDRDDGVRCRPGCALHWSWGADDGSDGAVYRPLADEFEIRISPKFNDRAAPETPGDAEVERWQVLSGDARNPDVTDLALDRPVTLRSESH